MLAHNIKDILRLVPEAVGLVKSANLIEDFPYDTKDSVCASYLRVHYLTKVAGKSVDPAISKKMEKAASLHGVKTELDGFVKRFEEASLEKTASANQLSLNSLELQFRHNLEERGYLNIEKAAEAAKAIYDNYGEDVSCTEVLRYAGHAYLNKEAAVRSLAARFHATKDADFVKVARIVADDIRENDFEGISTLCRTVTLLDKKAGLDIIGFDFYQDALLEKAAFDASCNISLAGKSYSWERVSKLGKSGVGNVVGEDVARELTGDACNDKAVLESLPRDLQMMLGKALDTYTK